MRILIITVAGMSRRFNRKCAKTVYYECSPKNSILYQVCLKAYKCDKIIIVGGYKIEDIKEYIESNMSLFKYKIELVFNSHFKDYGSGYSLMLGLMAAYKFSPDEIMFSEGDLYFDKESFDTVIETSSDVLTVNTLPIKANKSVVVYENANHFIRYIYDTKHKSLYIDERFVSIYNSAQIWKFATPKHMFSILKNLSQKQIQGTNLEIIGEYFAKTKINKIKIISVEEWINCNTIDDYKIIFEKINTVKKI
ncbi:MAG: hypothetical protein LBD17_02515 [Endomicrobium sp.]|jgi:choline kinase|nr:hypothetical protein [Endomicrobium sp.]